MEESDDELDMSDFEDNGTESGGQDLDHHMNLSTAMDGGGGAAGGDGGGGGGDGGG